MFSSFDSFDLIWFWALIQENLFNHFLFLVVYIFFVIFFDDHMYVPTLFLFKIYLIPCIKWVQQWFMEPSMFSKLKSSTIRRRDYVISFVKSAQQIRKANTDFKVGCLGEIPPLIEIYLFIQDPSLSNVLLNLGLQPTKLYLKWRKYKCARSCYTGRCYYRKRSVPL